MPKQKQRQVKTLGWVPDVPSHKDWMLALAKPQLLGAELPTVSADRRELGHNPPVRNQGALGSCVGFSAAYGVGYLRRTDRDRYSTVYSPLQLYYDARLRMGPEYKRVDSGAMIRDAMDVLRNLGTAPESNWPYVIRRYTETPSRSAYTAATKWKLGAHFRCQTIDQIMQAIHAGYAVVGGISVYSSMVSPAVDISGVIPMPARTDDLLGGHALYFDRFDRSAMQFRFLNSWGAEWGQGGYGYIPFDYIADTNLADDFWAMTSESPETTPWKD